VIGQYNCPFAAKSGGHAMFAGASSAPNGITIDLKYLDHLKLNDEKDTVSVGPGNRWGEVYRYLDAYNRTAVGGRVGDVGVGGFLLGGERSED
jgi:FAD/FMN-containing dehydrogenase